MAQRREDLRVADVDRKFVAERLKTAVDEGRLTLAEYDERLRDTYAAKTYGDLDKLIFDLPTVVSEPHSQLAEIPRQPTHGATDSRSAPHGTAAPYDSAAHATAGLGSPGARSPRGRDHRRGVPRWLIALWTAWAVAVSVNVMIWLLVSLSSGDLVYFWPMWVAGPWGVALLAKSVIGQVSKNVVEPLSEAPYPDNARPAE